MEPPEEWKLGNRFVTMEELEKYAAGVARSQEASNILSQVAGVVEDIPLEPLEEAVRDISAETRLDNKLEFFDKDIAPGQVAALAFMTPHELSFEDIIKAQEDDEECASRIRKLKEEGGSDNPRANYALVGSLLCKIRKERRLIVLPDIIAIHMLCIMHLFAHSPVDSLMKQFRFHYYAKDLESKANMVCQTCKACRLIKVPYKKRYPAGIVQRAIRFRQILSIDHFAINEMALEHAPPGDHTYNYVIAMTDQFTRFTWVKLVHSTLAVDTALALTEFFSAFGPWEVVASDGGPGMASNRAVYQVLRDLGIKVFVGVADHPQGHYIECNNKLLRKAANLIAAATNRNQVDCIYLGAMVTNMITRKYPILTKKNDVEIIEASAFEMVFGRSTVPHKLTVQPETDDFRALYDARDKLHEMMSRHVEENIRQHEERDNAAKDVFKVGDLVLVRQERSDKNSLNRFKRNIYRVTLVKFRKVQVKGLFREKPVQEVHINKCKRFVYHADLIHLSKTLKHFFGPAEEPEEGGEVPDFVAPAAPMRSVTRSFARMRQNYITDPSVSYKYAVASDDSEGSSDGETDVLSSHSSMGTTVSGNVDENVADLASEAGVPTEGFNEEIAQPPSPEVSFKQTPRIDWSVPDERENVQRPEKDDDTIAELFERLSAISGSDLARIGIAASEGSKGEKDNSIDLQWDEYDIKSQGNKSENTDEVLQHAKEVRDRKSTDAYKLYFDRPNETQNGSDPGKPVSELSTKQSSVASKATESAKQKSILRPPEAKSEAKTLKTLAFVPDSLPDSIHDVGAAVKGSTKTKATSRAKTNLTKVRDTVTSAISKISKVTKTTAPTRVSQRTKTKTEHYQA